MKIKSSNVRDSHFGGSYHWPPMWIGEDENAIDTMCSSSPDCEVLTRTLKCGIKAKVSIKGVFVFDFNEWSPGRIEVMENWEEPVKRRMRFLNLILACLYSSLFRQSKQTTDKMFIDYSTYAYAREFCASPSYFGCDLRQSAVISLNHDQHQRRRPWHDVVTTEVVEDAMRQADTAIADESNDCAILAELLLHAFQLHDSGKYEASHISAWTIAERCLHQLWRGRLENAESQFSNTTPSADEKFINAERMQKLTGRDFTASTISEVLSLTGVIDYEMYKLTCDVRQTRNKWLHNLGSISNQDSAKAIVLAQSALRRSGILDIGIPFHVIGVMPIAWISETDDGA